MPRALSLIRGHAEVLRLRMRVRGAVQGVGFRPFAYGLAGRFSLSGFVRNDAEGVLLEVEGEKAQNFVDLLPSELPPLARIDALEVEKIALQGQTGFSILDSIGGKNRTRIVADAAVCEACLDDLFDPTSRFHLYPFLSCTHCGPRFTITRALPYDRPQTSMADFAMCPDCARNYRDPKDRRFHAEPIACPCCGPRLSHTIAGIIEAIRSGDIVALKGIGGFHLLCDARNDEAVTRLRRRKARDAKPFAVMVANEASAAVIVEMDAEESRLLRDRARPIVVMRSRGGLAPSIAPNLNHIGVMLPYAPLHHLLFHAAAGKPCDYRRDAANDFMIVATSANHSGEPLIVDDAEAERELADIADLIVTHDRGIVIRADDSVMSIIDRAPAFVRRARGFVPDPIDLGTDGASILATGAHLKATVTVTRGREAFVSQHVGDLDMAATVRFYEETIRHLLAILDTKPELVACDLHPDFRSTRYAEATGLPILRVQHHVAHVAAVAAEHGIEGSLIGVALDGHGLGADGGAWGGELFRFNGADAKRLGHLRPLALPGGDRAAREPWRMGLAALAALGRLDAASQFFPEARAPYLAAMLQRGSAMPMTTSMGRLFDAAAALAGICRNQQYESQAAMEFEALVATPRAYQGGFAISEGVLDFLPLLAFLVDERPAPHEAAELFHGTLIEGLSVWIAAAAHLQGLQHVVLGGGCLMNRVLAEGLVEALRSRGLMPFIARSLPPNDGGLSFGQAAIARSMFSNTISKGEGSLQCASQFQLA
jgi:hydrogenase maturation protein HypF